MKEPLPSWGKRSTRFRVSALGKGEEDFSRAIETLAGVKQEKPNSLLLQKLAEYAEGY